MHELVREDGGRYAVVFGERGGPSFAGSLELASRHVLLTGTREAQRQELDLALAEIVEIRIGRLPADRLNGYRTLVLERAHGPAVQVAPLETGLLRELADLLAALTGEQATNEEQLAVVVPLKASCLQQARALLELGPPLDPSVLGLDSHRVYLREDDVVFVFTGPDVRTHVAAAMCSPALWRAGLAWRDCIADRPRIVEHDYLPLADASPDYVWTRSAW